jgi:anionic cell wall polymer biosynthesis LytR-Cps2A-Psr (LCP) family protein
MGLFSNFFDRFKAADFHLTPNKKIKSIQAEFKNNFGLTLRVYKGKALADPEMTFAQLNQRTSKEINAANSDLEIKANMNIGDFEKLIDKHFGVTVQVANEFDTYCVNNKYTLGQAARREDVEDWCKSKGFDSLEDWLKSENCKTLDEWYEKHGK